MREAPAAAPCEATDRVVSMVTPGDQSSIPASSDVLNGWKDIANYLGKGIRTVQRWERSYGLPVHRIAATRGEVVWASRTELDGWRSRGPAEAAPASTSPAEAAPGPSSESPALATVPPPASSRNRPLVAFAGVAVAVLLVAWLALRSSHGSPTLVARDGHTGPSGATFSLVVEGGRAGATMTRWTRLPNGNTEQLGEPISAAAGGVLAWNHTTDCRTETGTHQLWMVDDATGRSTNRVEIVVLANPACDRAMPDLVTRGVEIDRLHVRAGERVSVTLQVWNLGTAPAVATSTRLRLGAESARSRITDLVLGDQPTPEIAAGESVSLAATVTVPDGTPPGVYYVWAVADNGSATIEPSGFNNFARSTALVVDAPNR